MTDLNDRISITSIDEEDQAVTDELHERERLAATLFGDVMPRRRDGRDLHFPGMRSHFRKYETASADMLARLRLCRVLVRTGIDCGDSFEHKKAWPLP